MAKVSVTFAAPHENHKVGDDVRVDEDEARRLVGAGVACFSTVPDAKAAGGDPADAATKR